jgi:transcriptional regulator with XRE-family HTH domain
VARRVAMPLNEHLRKIRERKGWTQNHLAVVSGIPQPSIWRLEKGLILNPKTGLLRKLAAALEVSMEYLLTEEDSLSFDEILRHDDVGQAVFRGYERLNDQGKEQLKSFVEWLNEEAKKKGGQDNV